MLKKDKNYAKTRIHTHPLFTNLLAHLTITPIYNHHHIIDDDHNQTHKKPSKIWSRPSERG